MCCVCVIEVSKFTWLPMLFASVCVCVRVCSPVHDFSVTFLFLLTCVPVKQRADQDFYYQI